MNIKFLTLNIWQGGNLLEEASLFLKEEDPDILVMQEVYNGKIPSYEQKYRTFDEVRKILEFPYASFSPAFLDTRTIGDIDRGNATFSKFPILKNTTISYDIPYGPYDEGDIQASYENVPMCIQHGIISIQNLEYQVFNLQGVWGQDAKDNERRLRMSNTLIDQIRGKQRVILAGDFNLNPNTKTIKNIEKRLQNVFKSELITTFNMKHKKKPELAKSVVDMIFLSDDINCISHYCPSVDISDHLPLICILNV